METGQCFCAPEVDCEGLVHQSCCSYETDREDAGTRDLQAQLFADCQFSSLSCLHVTRQRLSHEVVCSREQQNWIPAQSYGFRGCALSCWIPMGSGTGREAGNVGAVVECCVVREFRCCTPCLRSQHPGVGGGRVQRAENQESGAILLSRERGAESALTEKSPPMVPLSFRNITPVPILWRNL